MGDPGRRRWPRRSDVSTPVVDDLITGGGVRPVEQGEGDSFVVAFARAQ